MKVYRTVPKHVEETQKYARTLCDRCSKDVDSFGEAYDMTEVTIEARIGSYYPEGDSRTAYVADCCANCFVEHVVPALKSLGFSVREYRSEDNEPRTVEPAAKHGA